MLSYSIRGGYTPDLEILSNVRETTIVLFFAGPLKFLLLTFLAINETLH